MANEAAQNSHGKGKGERRRKYEEQVECMISGYRKRPPERQRLLILLLGGSYKSAQECFLSTVM